MAPRGRGRGQNYIQSQLKELKNVSIPDKVKCSRCHKYKNQSNYSEKQLNDVRHAIKYKNQHTGWLAKCVTCSGGPLVEIECTVCRVTKGLEEFAKSQRKKPDEAECFKCTDKRLAVDAVDDEAYEHKDRARAFAQNTSGWILTPWDTTASASAEKWETHSAADSEAGGVDLAEAFDNQMSFSGASKSGTLIDTGNGQTEDEDGWQTAQGKSWHTESGPTSSSGFDPNKYGNPNASRSISVSRQSFTSSVAERSEPVAKGGWAKIKAYDPKKDPNAVAKQPVEEWSSDESDSDDDDDIGDDDEEI